MKKRCAVISRKDSQLLSESERERWAGWRMLHVCSVFQTSWSETSKCLQKYLWPTPSHWPSHQSIGSRGLG